MFCDNCGTELKDGVKFCPKCGAEVKEVKSQISSEDINNKSVSHTEDNPTVAKVNKIIAILNIVMGGIVLLIGIMEIDFVWGEYAIWFSAGLIASGILQLLRKSSKVVSVILIIAGGLTLFVGLGCDLDYDWGYIGILAGAGMLVCGILNLLHKSVKAISIVEIVFGGLLLVCAFLTLEMSYGWIALAGAAAFLTGGILKLVNLESYRKAI